MTSVLCGLQDAVEPSQNGERKDDLAVVTLLVVTSQQVGDGPDECREVGIGHASERLQLDFQLVLVGSHPSIEGGDEC